MLPDAPENIPDESDENLISLPREFHETHEFHPASFLFRVLFSATILAASIGGAFLFGKMKAPPVRAEIGKNIPSVQVEEVKTQENGLTFTVTGVVVPFREVPIAPEVSGRISFLADNCRVGRYVRKGDELLRIDSADYELFLEQARQQALQAERSVVELDVSIRNSKEQLKIAQEQLAVQAREVARVQELAKTEAISKTDLDNTLLGQLARRDSVQMLENQVRTLESQRERVAASKKLASVAVEKAQLDLNRCTLYAPLDGVVVIQKAEEDKFAQRGESLLTIHDTSRLEVQCSLYMKHVEWLWSTRKDEKTSADPHNFYQFAPTPVTIVYKLGETEYAWQGVLEFLDGPGLDSRTMMLPCRIVVNDPLDVTVEKAKNTARLVDRPALLPGMFVQVKVHVKPKTTLLDISEMAILPGGTVWKVVDGKLKRSPVVTAQVQEGRVLVYEEPGVIQAGDTVVVSPLASPVEGTDVETVGDGLARPDDVPMRGG